MNGAGKYLNGATLYKVVPNFDFLSAIILNEIKSRLVFCFYQTIHVISVKKRSMASFFIEKIAHFLK